MELELGLKITQTKGDLTSTTSFQMAKDCSAPIFMSTQTDSKFILTAHLKGFGKEDIGIKINEDGTQIAIRMEKPVQEMVMTGLMFHKKEVEMKGFARVFQIPSCVDLDRIKAKFNARDSVLTIVMPKSKKLGKTSQASLHDKFDGESISGESKQGMKLRENVFESCEFGNTKDELETVEAELFQGFKAMKDETQQLTDVKTNIEEEEEAKKDDTQKQGMSTTDLKQEEEEAKKDDTQKQGMSTTDQKQEEEEAKKNDTQIQEMSTTDQKQEEEESPKKHFQLCKPCVIAGSSIIVVLVVLAIHWIRSSKRKQLY